MGTPVVRVIAIAPALIIAMSETGWAGDVEDCKNAKVLLKTDPARAAPILGWPLHSAQRPADFDDCGFSWCIYDLATALSFLEARPFVPDLIASWIKGYRKVATLSRDTEDVAEIAWLGTRRHLKFAQSLGAGFTSDSCHLVADYLRRYG